MDYFTYNTYAENIKAAEYFIKMAKEHDLGRRWNTVGALAFAVFSIEAFINHAGEAQDDMWRKWDRENRPNPEEKLKRLSVTLDVSIKEYFTELFQLRNMIAHGRTVTVKKKVRKPQNNLKGAMANLSSEFESRTTLKKVENLVSRAKDIVSFINDSTIKLSSHRLWSIGNGSLRTS
jgi:hypothetical protein